MFHRSCVLLLVILSTNVFVYGQDESINLISTFSNRQRVAGVWTLNSEGLQVDPEKVARCSFNAETLNGYVYSVDFTRMQGNDSVAMLLPVDGKTIAFEVSSWEGAAHGLARVNEQTSLSEANPTSVRPGILANGKRHRMVARVTPMKSGWNIIGKLNGKELFNWSGKSEELQSHLGFRLPDETRPGLASQNNQVIFHRVEWKPLGVLNPISSKPLSEVKSKVFIDLQTLIDNSSNQWERFNGANFRVTSQGDRVFASSIPSAGSQDRGAYVKGVSFSEGTIELDLRGTAQPQGSFLGIVFNGRDGKSYESVYFRSFNFKQPDLVRRSHAVQYICHPDWPWDRLRNEKNGEYEKGVLPEPDPTQWFHARIEIDSNRVKVYVENSENPSLDVKRLTSGSGKVGLWFNGAADFSNLKIMPAS